MCPGVGGRGHRWGQWEPVGRVPGRRLDHDEAASAPTGGYYHGKLIFPREFPFRPPSIYMITPSGRFKCNTR